MEQAAIATHVSPAQLFADNMRLAPWAIQRYKMPRSSAMEREDMEQIAYLALWDAANRFDPSLGYKFSTLAVAAINQRVLNMLRGFKAKSRDGVSLSIDYTTEDDSGHETAMAAYLTGPKLDDTAACVNEFVQSLPRMQRRMLMLRIDDYTQEEIAARLGISQAHVSRTLVAIGKDYEARYMDG